MQPNVFRINAFAKAIDTISRIEETIKSGDDYVLEVCAITVLVFRACDAERVRLLGAIGSGNWDWDKEQDQPVL